MTMIMDLDAKRKTHSVPGKCAACDAEVFESLATLDDAYNVWAGKCPHCKAINLLGLTGLRGYSSGGMDLVLPTDEEKAANGLPDECPTQGSKGPAEIHGTIAGEIQHQLRNAMSGAASPLGLAPEHVRVTEDAG